MVADCVPERETTRLDCGGVHQAGGRHRRAAHCGGVADADADADTYRRTDEYAGANRDAYRRNSNGGTYSDICPGDTDTYAYPNSCSCARLVIPFAEKHFPFLALKFISMQKERLDG